jgi:hypothetical protein
LILFGGIALRVILFLVMEPLNVDKHFQVVQHIYDHGQVPISRTYSQAFHPPLYYVLAAPLLAFGRAKAAQLLSLAASIATLWVLKVLASDRRIIRSAMGRDLSLGLAAFLPTFVVYGLYVSNDGLSYLMGALILLALRNLCDETNVLNVLYCACFLGLGILTKGTLLAFVPVAGLCLLVLCHGKGIDWRRTTCLVAVLAIVTICLGSYKFIENTIHEGRPVVHNLDYDPAWAEEQRPVYVGPQSLYNFDLSVLIWEPTLSKEMQQSWPLMLYGTHWYIPFHGVVLGFPDVFLMLGRMVYVFALVPSLVMVCGLMRQLKRFPSILTLTAPSERGPGDIAGFFSVLALLSVFGLVIVAGAKYDVWCSFHSRLLYSGFFGLMVVLGSGTSLIRCQDSRLLNWILGIGCAILGLLYGVYFLSGFPLAALFSN